MRGIGQNILRESKEEDDKYKSPSIKTLLKKIKKSIKKKKSKKKKK